MATNQFKLNPWMQEVLDAFKSSHSERELRNLYWEAHKTDPELSWKDFVQESALREKLGDPVLGTRIDDTVLPPNNKTAFHDAYIDWIANLMQFSEDGLRHLKGMHDEDVDVVVKFLSDRSIVLLPNSCFNVTYVVLGEQIKESQRSI